MPIIKSESREHITSHDDRASPKSKMINPNLNSGIIEIQPLTLADRLVGSNGRQVDENEEDGFWHGSTTDIFHIREDVVPHTNSAQSSAVHIPNFKVGQTSIDAGSTRENFLQLDAQDELNRIETFNVHETEMERMMESVAQENKTTKKEVEKFQIPRLKITNPTTSVSSSTLIPPNHTKSGATTQPVIEDVEKLENNSQSYRKQLPNLFQSKPPIITECSSPSAQRQVLKMVNQKPSNQYSLKIKSSRAFSNTEHQNLHEILEKLDRVASNKMNKDIEIMKTNFDILNQKKKGQSLTERRKSLLSDQISQQILQSKKLQSTDQQIYKLMKGPPRSPRGKSPGKQSSGLLPLDQQRDQLSRFDQKGAKLGQSSSALAYTSRGGSVLGSKPISPVNLKDESTIFGRDNARKMKYSVNSYRYLQSQWKDINKQTKDRMEFIKNYAQQQNQSQSIYDRQMSKIYEKIREKKNHNGDIDYFDLYTEFKKGKVKQKVSQTILNQYREIASYLDTDKKAVKTLDRILNRRKPELQHGIELNRKLLGEIQSDRNLQEQILRKTYNLSIYNKGDDGQTNYQKLQRLHNRPGPEAARIKEYFPKEDEIIKADKLDVEKISEFSRTQVRTTKYSPQNKRSKSQSGVANVHQGGHYYYPQDFKSQKDLPPAINVRHDKIICIRDKLLELIQEFLQDKNKGGEDGKKDKNEFTKEDVLKIFGRVLNEGQPTDQDSDPGYLIQNQIEKVLQSKKNLSSIRRNSVQLMKNKRSKYRQMEKDSQFYIIEALEELPEPQLTRLFEIVTSPPVNVINMVKAQKKKEQQSRTSLMHSSSNPMQGLTSSNVSSSSKIYQTFDNPNLLTINQLPRDKSFDKSVKTVEKSSIQQQDDYDNVKAMNSNLDTRSNAGFSCSAREIGRHFLLGANQRHLKFKIDLFTDEVSVRKKTVQPPQVVTEIYQLDKPEPKIESTLKISRSGGTLQAVGHSSIASNPFKSPLDEMLDDGKPKLNIQVHNLSARDDQNYQNIETEMPESSLQFQELQKGGQTERSKPGSTKNKQFAGINLLSLQHIGFGGQQVETEIKSPYPGDNEKRFLKTVLGVNEPIKSKNLHFGHQQLSRQPSKTDSERKQEDLTDLFSQIIETKQDMFPTFSGYLGENFRKMGQKMNILQMLGKQKQEEQNLDTQNTIQIEENEQIGLEIFDEENKNRKIQLIPSKLRQFQYYEERMKDYSPNNEMETEVQRIKDDLCSRSTTKKFGLGATFQINQIERLTGSHFFSLYSMHPDNFSSKKKNFLVEQLNLQRLAQNNGSGLYYMMLVVQQKIGDIKHDIERGLHEQNSSHGGSIYQHAKQHLIQRKQTQGQYLMQKIKKSFILGSFSPYKQVDQIKQVMKDSENLILMLCTKSPYSVGSKPCSRKFFGCSFAQGRFFIYGGVAIKNLNDLKSLKLGKDDVYAAAKSQIQLEWRCEDSSLMVPTKYKYYNTQRKIQQEHNIDSTEEDDENYEMGDKQPAYKRGIRAQLERRFSMTMNTYNNRYLIVFGGAGKFIRKIQKRETFNSLYFLDRLEVKKEIISSVQQVLNVSKSHSGTIYDSSSKSFDSVDLEQHHQREEDPKWVDMSEDPADCQEKQEIMNNAKFDKTMPLKGNDIKDYGAPRCRAQHAAAVYGGCFMIHGGFQGEASEVLGDVALFDIALGMWVRCKQPKKNRAITQIGPRYYHSLTSVQDINIVLSKRNSRLMWIHDPAQIITQDTDPMIKNRNPYFSLSGMFLFGGLDDKQHPRNDLFLLTPHYSRNQKYLMTGSGNYKKIQAKNVKNKIQINFGTLCYQVKNLSQTSKGKPPIPRYGHAASFIQHYLVIHGGRNDELYNTKISNIGMNDLHLFDVQTQCWMGLAVYGQGINNMPTSRWGHCICTEDNELQDYQSNRMIVFGGVNLQSYCDSSVYVINIDPQTPLQFIEENENRLRELYIRAKQQYNQA